MTVRTTKQYRMDESLCQQTECWTLQIYRSLFHSRQRIGSHVPFPSLIPIRCYNILDTFRTISAQIWYRLTLLLSFRCLCRKYWKRLLISFMPQSNNKFLEANHKLSFGLNISFECFLSVCVCVWMYVCVCTLECMCTSITVQDSMSKCVYVQVTFTCNFRKSSWFYIVACTAV